MDINAIKDWIDDVIEDAAADIDAIPHDPDIEFRSKDRMLLLHFNLARGVKTMEIPVPHFE